MVFYGVGNAGTAITSFLAPVIATSVAGETTVQCYLVLLAAFALMNFLLGDRRKEKKVNTPLMEQIKGVYKK